MDEQNSAVCNTAHMSEFPFRSVWKHPPACCPAVASHCMCVAHMTCVCVHVCMCWAPHSCSLTNSGVLSRDRTTSQKMH